MVASLWNVGRERSRWTREHLIDPETRIQARNPSRGPHRDRDLKIGATIVRLVHTGRGWLFECPRGCGRTVLHIYLPPDGEPGCRDCLGLKYSCRHVGRDMPEAQRIVKLREKLGANPRPFSPLPPRPKWARRAPYLRKVQAIAELEDRLAGRFTNMVGDLERRARVRKLKP
jgi:hypothetical protein